MKFSTNFFALLFLLSFSSMLSAQIVVNEYSASNLKQYPDSYEKFEDWIELYNTSSSAVDIGGWYLSDKENKPEKWQFPAGTMIPGNGFVTVWCSGRDESVGNEIHTNFKLTQTKGNEVITLSNPALELQESIPMEITQMAHSRARSEDGTGDWMISTYPSFKSSNNSNPKFPKYSAKPIINLVGGFYNSTLEVSILSAEPNAVIYYTTNGLQPDENATEFTGPITIDETTVLKAIAISNDPDILPGLIDFQTYFINENFTLPVLSVAADELLDLAAGNRDLRPIGTIEYFEDGEKVTFSYGELNSHGQDSWALPHRSLDWISRDEMGYNSTVKAKLFEYTDRDEFQRVMMRASGDDNYPAINDYWHQGSTHIRDEFVHTLVREGDMKCDVRGVRRMIVFLNGNYWGVYGIRERPADHDYTAYYYDQGKYDLQYLSTWGQTWAEYGGDQAFSDWRSLRNFILNNDMSDPNNYETVKDQLNVTSLIDYMITNLNAVASDWLNYNTGWWRGTNPDGDHKKWGYIIWDLDATFDYYINYSGVPNTDPDAVPCDIEDISDFMDDFFSGQGDVGKHEKIFLKLQEENDEFRQLYYSRQADLMNGVFSCENMLGTLDRMLAVIEPEMPRQIQRWGGSMNEWEANVEDLKDFIAARCELLDDGISDCYNLTGPYLVTLKTEPDGAGEIDFNTYDIEEFPWSGEYFGNMDNLIKAKAFDDDWEFSHWETANGSVIFPDSESRKASMRITGPDILTAHFREKSSTGNTNIEQLSKFSIYPTIVNDFINIDFELTASSDVQLELYNVSGKKIMNLNKGIQRFPGGAHNLTIPIDQNLVAAGVYLVKFRIDQGVKTEKIIIGK